MSNYSTLNNKVNGNDLNNSLNNFNGNNGIYDDYLVANSMNRISSSSPKANVNSNMTNRRKGTIPYIFTNDPAQLRGEILTTVIQKGNKGLGFTLIGNDGSSSEPEFIQVCFYKLPYNFLYKNFCFFCIYRLRLC